MITLDIKKVKQANLVAINRNSVVLEVAPNEQVYCTRKVFNKLIKEDDNFPVFVTEREFLGNKYLWIAIPMTL